MVQKYAFTTAAMAAALEDTPVSYEDLAEIEKDFDDVETEIIRQQVHLTAPLYARRQKLVAQIPNFWPLVLEQAPPDIDQYIQPSDSALLLSSLTSLSVRHFELEDSENSAVAGPKADPRSVAIRWEFAPNEYFENITLEKKFWYRRARDGWTGFVSEPVPVAWKKGKDLTGGLLDLVCKAWETEQALKESQTESGNGKQDTKDLSPEHKALRKKIDQTGMGGLSFFAWFGFIGRKVSAKESAEATEKETNARERRRKGEKAPLEEEANDDEDEEEIDLSLEIFPDGDDLALAIKDDLWPEAIKYFTQAQENDALSDDEFESDDDIAGGEGEDSSEDEDAEEEEGERPAKKRKA